MTYLEQLNLSWALSWRLLLSNIVILLVLAMLTIAFASPRSAATGMAFFGLFFAMECLMAWPFVLRRTLPPQIFALPRGFSLRYWPAVLFGVSADLMSALPLVLLQVVLLHLLGAKPGSFIALTVFSVRLFVVLPIFLGFVARRPALS
jgi:hypothetical protein